MSDDPLETISRLISQLSLDGVRLADLENAVDHDALDPNQETECRELIKAKVNETKNSKVALADALAKAFSPDERGNR